MHYPSQDQWTVEFSAQLIERDTDAADDLWCSQFADAIAPTARHETKDNTSVTYSFTPIPQDEDDAMVYPYLRGTVIISRDKPSILSFHLYAPASFKPVWLARIDQMEFCARCQPTTDGRSRIVSLETSTRGRIALNSFNERERRDVISVRPTSAADGN